MDGYIKTSMITSQQWKSELSFQDLKDITNNFSDERILDKGGFGVVYKGLLDNGETVAVKKLLQATPNSLGQLENELILLKKLEHVNIVRLRGHCYETEPTPMCQKGKSFLAWDNKILLCLEYMPNGSLEKYIKDASLCWHTCWKIIKGISYGLQYLHEHSNEPIIHLDLKPANILLDANMLPKITDFGMSRLFHNNQTICTASAGGTLGYMPPEYTRGIITPMWDIFSLGVIIMEVITGHRKYPDDIRKDYKGFIELELQKWRNRMRKEPGFTSLEEDCQLIERCIQIGLICMNPNRAKRPTINKVIDMLEGTECMNWYIRNEAEHALNEEHHGMPNSPGETSSRENVTAVLEAGTNTCNSIWENTANHGKFNEIMNTLNPDTRRCFEFCSIFPRGSMLRRHDLVHLWIAQGFVKTICTEELEDIAGGYIQDLVSISFLEPIRTWSDIDCFTIHDVLHAMLDKVTGNCFRIENARSHSGECWEGDVPRHIHHLLIQHYDGELITKTIIGLEYLRTLIVYVVEKDTPIEEKVIESICKGLPKLQVLAIAFSWEHDQIRQPKVFSFPESVGQLEYLRYLAFRANSKVKITLPGTLNKLQHIQLLDFAYGNILEFAFSELVNLQHIFCCSLVKVAYIGRLSSLQTLQGFVTSNDQGCELKQLRELNKLRGSLWICGLENVKSKEKALEANLSAKRITELSLEWGYDYAKRCSPEVITDVVEGLCPPVGLIKLNIWYFLGSRYPYWMVNKHSGGPKDLQQLYLCNCSQLGSASALAKAFPHLRVLKLHNCSWENLPANMDHLTSLKKLDLYLCKNIRSLPTLPLSLEEFRLGACNDEFTRSCQTVGHPNWQKIEHIPNKLIKVIQHEGYVGRLRDLARQMLGWWFLPLSRASKIPY